MVRFEPSSRPKSPGLWPGREALRLAAMVAALVLVTLLVVQLRRPETAEKLDRLFAADDHGIGASADGAESPATANPGPQRTAYGAEEFRTLLGLAGWDAERFAAFDDGQPLTDSERETLLGLLHRLTTIDASEFQSASAVASIEDSPQAHRGDLVSLKGRVTRVERRTLPADLARRLEMPAYTECDLAMDDGGRATIIAARVPEAWLGLESLDEPAEAVGVFVKLLPTGTERPVALFVSREVAWHPRQVHEPHVTFGDVVLGKLGMDVGLLDDIAQRRPILPQERDTFYALLAATDRAGSEPLIRLANANLPAVREAWAAEADRLAGSSDQADRQRLQLAREVVARADDGRYSVAPLFNDPATQVGQLVALDGVARRAVRIDVGSDADGRPSDVARRFGIDHYYELDVFTDDSQNNPVVFCVTELPRGFPTGESIREPVRVAGFFLKSWSFESRRGAAPDAEGQGGTAASVRQFAPLLIGRGPVWLESPQPARSTNTGYLLAAGFLAIIAAIWTLGWYFARDERKFADQRLMDRSALPPGESLNDLSLPADDSPSA